MTFDLDACWACWCRWPRRWCTPTSSMSFTATSSPRTLSSIPTARRRSSTGAWHSSTTIPTGPTHSAIARLPGLAAVHVARAGGRRPAFDLRRRRLRPGRTAVRMRDARHAASWRNEEAHAQNVLNNEPPTLSTDSPGVTSELPPCVTGQLADRPRNDSRRSPNSDALVECRTDGWWSSSGPGHNRGTHYTPWAPGTIRSTRDARRIGGTTATCCCACSVGCGRPWNRAYQSPVSRPGQRAEDADA